MSGAFDAKVALVTGSSRGIGLGMARLLADRGAKVVINSRSQGRLDNVAAELRARGADVVSAAGDVGDPEAVDRIVSHAVDSFGRIDILVNNAALANPTAHLLDLDARRW